MGTNKTPVPSGKQPEDAMDVLRALWAGQCQSSADLEEALAPQKSCRSMRHVGFDNLAGPDGDLRSAWRATLRREGKLNPDAGSVADLVFGSTDRRAGT